MLSVTHYVTHLNEKKYCNYYARTIDTFFSVVKAKAAWPARA